LTAGNLEVAGLSALIERRYSYVNSDFDHHAGGLQLTFVKE